MTTLAPTVPAPVTAAATADDDDWMTPKEVAALFKISVRTLGRWDQELAGFPKAFYLPPSYTTRRYRGSEIRAFKRLMEQHRARARVAPENVQHPG